jgi:Lon protease-like protein
MTAVELPMFPLGTALVPHQVLPLQVFEPRYLQMVVACLAGDGRFGVVLIERGSEVGGGDVRFDVGTVAEIREVRELGEGRLGVVAVGVERLRVRRWLPDDPFPRAIVAPSPGDAGAVAVADLAPLHEAWDGLVAAVRARSGGSVPDHWDLAEDPLVAPWQALAWAPLTPLDVYAVLAEDDERARLARVVAAITDVSELIRMTGG